ncbi:MAG: DPP IV N-terminal domain-containing protein [Dysgonomonas sp.]|nr:DPP IV N-terminal domain-containing protein [Dysgonomonas sp.]
MKIIKSIVLYFLISLPTILMSQNNPIQLSLDDLIPGGTNYNKYRIIYPKQIQWWGDIPVYIKGDSIISLSSSEKEQTKIIFEKNAINSTLKDEDKIKNLGILSFPYPDQKIILINQGTNIRLFDFDTKSTLANYNISGKASNHDFAKDSRMLAYTKNNNLYVMDSSGSETEITSDTDSNIVNGQSVHRNEFGIHKGTFWSPQGTHLAFYRMDETMVTDYPLVDISSRVAKLKNIKYPMAGMKSHQVTVGIFSPITKKKIFLKTEAPKDKYLTNIAWSPDEKFIYITELNRGQDTCKLVRYNAGTGDKDAILFTETHPKYVEPENPILFNPKNPDLFVWQSKRDGHNHLYLYNSAGTLKQQLTSGEWDVTELLGFDEAGKNLYYISTEVSPIEQHIYSINISNGKKTQLSKEEGIHKAILSPSGKYIFDIYSSQNNPGKVILTQTDNNKSKPFFEAKNPYKNITLPEITLSSLKANDGKTDLYYRLTKPTNFDPQKKYPVIIYVYGGPHSQLVNNSWLGQARGWDIYMAQKGYIVFTLDNRGTNNRGRDFENITHRQLGVIETQDQMTGLEFLKSLPFVDTTRIGVHGWSYGGFMTLNLMLKHPETFKVGVAGGPVTDWKYYEIMYGERYMDTPKENPEGYQKSSMVDRAGDLKGRLLIIHGDEDPVVVMQHSLQFLKSAIQKGTHPDFFIYPGHEHNMTGKDRIHLHEHITRYFEDFL